MPIVHRSIFQRDNHLAILLVDVPRGFENLPQQGARIMLVFLHRVVDVRADGLA